MEACLELIKTGYVVGMQDMGAAGLTSSSVEMAARAGTGIEMDVALVPRREKGMTPYEVLLSESQERMLVVPQKGREKEVRDIFAKWGLEAVVIGWVTEDGNITVKEEGRVVAQIPAKALTDLCPSYSREAVEPAYLAKAQEYDLATLQEMDDYSKIILALLGSANIGSKEWVYRQYDYMVGVNAVVGRAVMPHPEDQRHKQRVAATTDCNSRYVCLTRRGGRCGSGSARNLVCSGLSLWQLQTA